MKIRDIIITEDQQLSELNLLAPETTYVRLGTGKYVKAEWRRSGGGNKTTASFVGIEAVDDNEAKKLGLDNRLKTKKNEITKGGDIQQSTPLSPRRVTVADFNDKSPHGQQVMKNIPQNISQEIIKAVQQSGK
tara:strand:+ start:375 stop:773 length:399 start_codon:yes stop_codon:yes gene_type:complete